MSRMNSRGQQMTMDQLQAFVRSQEKDNMRSQYQASFSNGNQERRWSRFRPQTAKADKNKLRESAQRFKGIVHQQNGAYNPTGPSRQTRAEQSRQQYSSHSQLNSHRGSQQAEYCAKHNPQPGTIQHRSSKAQNLMSPQPTRPQSSYQDQFNLREMDTGKFLQTNLKQYLEKDEHVTCISCQNCVRIKDKVLQYKYNGGLKSSYGANYKNTHGHRKETVWNLDNEKRQLRVPYKPPTSFVTTNGSALINSKGTGMIGAMTSDGKGYVRSGAPKGETEDDVPRAFVNNSSYQLTYPIYGKLPDANKRPQKPFAPGYGKIDTKSAYQTTFLGSPDEKYIETAKAEKQRVKAYQKQQVRGTLNPSVPLRFNGQSTAQKEFVNRKNDAVEKVLPFDMLVVPHGMSMHTKSEARSNFNAKPIRKLH